MSSQPTIPKFQKELVGRLVSTSLSLWNNYSTTSKDTGDKRITGKILSVGCVKGKFKAEVLYDQYNDIGKLLCKVKVNTIRKMLQPLNFQYGGPSSMFDSDSEESESDNDITNFDPDDDSATEEEIDEPTTKKEAIWKRKRKRCDYNDDILVETVCSEPLIVDTSDDLDDESNEEEEEEDDDNN